MPVHHSVCMQRWCRQESAAAIKHSPAVGSSRDGHGQAPDQPDVAGRDGTHDDDDGSVRTQVMPAGTAPPPSSTDRSCVYVVKRPDGMFYCGQSDRLAGESSLGCCPSCSPELAMGLKIAAQCPMSMTSPQYSLALAASALLHCKAQFVVAYLMGLPVYLKPAVAICAAVSTYT